MSQHTLKKIQYDNIPIQVESAIRDGDGATISSTYVKKNSSITGATKCKITYDAKGLVTSGGDLAASDIPSLAASKITSGTFAAARLLEAYPVGSVYISKENTSPAGLIGGTWQSYGAVYFLTAATAPVKTGARHDGNATALNFDFINGSTTTQCNQTSNQNALTSDGVSLTISQLNGASWGSNWGGYGTIVPNNLHANMSTSTVYMWKRTA